MASPSQWRRDGMTIFGVGPVWVAITAVLTVTMLAWTGQDPAAWRFPGLPGGLRVGLGACLVALGAPFFVWSVVILRRGFPRGELFTSGPYAACRHPVYGVWCALIVPGIALLVDRWPGLLVVAAMWVLLRLLVRREDAWLERTFGDAYRAYRARTPAVVPLLWRLWG